MSTPDTATVAQIEGDVAALIAQGYGETHLHPHVPFVGESPLGAPALMWRMICTAGGCGEYIDDVATEPAIDEMCERCLTSGKL